MVLYKCNNCDKIFYQKSNYEYHLNRKIPCKKLQKIDEQNCTEIHEQNCTEIHEQNCTEIHEQNCTKDHEIIKLNNRKCPHCYKIFTRSSSLNMHLRSRCKVKKREDEQKKEEDNKLVKEIEELKQKDNKLVKEIEELKQKVHEINEMKLEINNIKRNLEKQRELEDKTRYVYAIDTGQTDDNGRIIYKCGRMSGSISKILSRYGTYYPKLKLEFVLEVKNDCLIEHKLFEILKEYKHNAKREFLICDLDKIKSTFRDIILEYD